MGWGRGEGSGGTVAAPLAGVVRAPLCLRSVLYSVHPPIATKDRAAQRLLGGVCGFLIYRYGAHGESAASRSSVRVGSWRSPFPRRCTARPPPRWPVAGRLGGGLLRQPWLVEDLLYSTFENSLSFGRILASAVSGATPLSTAVPLPRTLACGCPGLEIRGLVANPVAAAVSLCTPTWANAHR